MRGNIKPKFQNLKYLLKYAWIKCKAIYFSSFFKYVFVAIIPLVGVFGLGTVVDALETGGDVKRTIVQYALFELSVTVFSELFTLIDNVVARKASNITQFDYMADSICINYHYAQDGSVLDLRKKSMRAHPVWFMTDIGEAFKYIVQFLGVIVAFAKLRPLFILIISIISAVGVFLSFRTKRIEFEFQNERIVDDRRAEYLFNTLTNYTYAKEVRVNHGSSYIKRKYQKVMQEQLCKIDDFLKRKMHIGLIETVIIGAQTAIMYFYFSYSLYHKQISVSEYTVLLGSTTLFVSISKGFFEKLAKIKNTLKYTDLFKQYKEYVDSHSNIKNGECDICISEQIESIRFEDVSFSYPGNTIETLKNLCFEIKRGEKIGIVGLNGSGKTTLIKLMCRFYDPDKGRILINDRDIRYIPYGQYSQLISIVLQDYFLFSYPIWENISFCLDYNTQRLKECIDISGLAEKVKSLPKEINTSINKDLDSAGVEFSGGEAQKLALARALYKNSQILILDEPTSAMDPIAEYELFSKLSVLAKSKTVIFISHRLSSTLFCDNIFVFENGTIVEHGNHTELIEKKGIYESLFSSQAKYYKREV